MKPAGKALSASIYSLGQAVRKKRLRDATQLELMLREVADPSTASRLAAAYAERFPDPSKPKVPFVMLSPQQNSAVVDWLYENSKRPQKAARLWAKLFTALRSDTGEILLTRDDIAERIGIRPQEVSAIMTELASINAIVRERQGREMRYRMNATIATHLPSETLREEARTKDGPLMVLMQGGRHDEALDASV